MAGVLQGQARALGQASAWTTCAASPSSTTPPPPTGKPNRRGQRAQVLAGLLHQVAGLGRLEQFARPASCQPANHRRSSASWADGDSGRCAPGTVAAQ